MPDDGRVRLSCHQFLVFVITLYLI